MRASLALVVIGMADGFLAVVSPVLAALVLAVPFAGWLGFLMLAAPHEALAPLLILGAIAGAWTPPVLSAGGLNLRLSQVALAVALLLVVLRPGMLSWPRWQRPYAWAAAGVTALALLWSLLRSPDLSLALGHTLLLALNLVTFVLMLAVLGEGSQGVDRALRLLAWGSIAVTAWTVAILLGALSGIGAFQDLLAPEQIALVGEEGISASMFPRLSWGVVIGSFAASFSVGLGGAALAARGRTRALMAIGAMAGLLGVVLGVARAPILALGVGGSVFALGLLLCGRVGRSAQFVLGGAVGLALLVAAISRVQTDSFPLREAVFGKALQLFVLEEYGAGTAGGRLDIWRPMLADVARSPLTGQGVDAYRRYVPPAHQASENFPLEILHATGVPGFALYVALHGLLLATLVRVAWCTRFRTTPALTALGLAAAHLGLTVASATNPAAGGAVYWVLFALAIAASRRALWLSSVAAA